MRNLVCLLPRAHAVRFIQAATGFCSLLVGCGVFDESLYMEAETEFADSEGDGGLRVANECFVDELPVFSESATLVLDLSEFESTGLGYPLCPGDVKEFPGADAYFKLAAEAGDRWNINAAPQSPEVDVAVLNLGTGCTPTGCRAAQNRCDVGFNEDTAIIASETTEYVIAIETISTVGGKVNLTLEKSRCGNGVVEAGETCDGGESCDDECRRVVTNGTVEEGEPNDIFTGVDMIGDGVSDALVRVRGSVGGKCDEDHYAFIVPEGASASVRMFGPDGGPCSDDVSKIVLPFVDFWADGGPRKIGDGVIDLESPSGGCPSIEGVRQANGQSLPGEDGTEPADFSFATDLPASEYHVIINAFVTDQPVPYEIEFEIDVP